MSGRIGTFLSIPIKTESMPPCLLHGAAIILRWSHYAKQDANVPVTLLTKLQDQENKHTKNVLFYLYLFLTIHYYLSNVLENRL